jgi:hypothetical protein
LTSGSRHDVTELVPLIDKIPPLRSRRERARRRPDQLFGDRAYDHDKYRWVVRAKGIHEAFLGLATCIITFRHVIRPY